ncbi:unnamed protein product [Ectocarpus sp. CCAP 1310/34]|nr:unnamed protein product [Ectocarpus sp. CCAP 1310/34]
MVRPRYTNRSVCLYVWPAALTVNGRSSIPFGSMHMISVFGSDTISPNRPATRTMTDIIFSRLSGERETMAASSA